MEAIRDSACRGTRVCSAVSQATPLAVKPRAPTKAQAASHGVNLVRLDTNKVLTEAIAMYRAAGYREVDAFNDETYAHHWFEKTLNFYRL